MKRTVLIILAVLVVLFGAYLVSQMRSVGAMLAEDTPSPADTSAQTFDQPPAAVEALGRVVPARYSEVQFFTSGILHEILVEEGQTVQAGDVLARLRDERQMKLAVSQAEFEVLNAEKFLADLEQNAPLQAAQAFYDMAMIEKEMEKVQKRRTAMDYPKATKEDIEKAYDAYRAAEDTFNQASDYFKPTDDAYKAAKAQRDTALNTYNWLISKYTDLEKREIEANYQLLERRHGELERQYAVYAQGPDPQEVALAEARLQLAKEQLAAAQAGYDDLVLRAPFDGVVVQLNREAGQVIAAGQPLLLLADLSRWVIETEDMTELSITQIEEGDAAQVWIDALPEAMFQGVVKKIKPIGETRRGDITYTVVIELVENDSRLRWNMTSPVTIDTADSSR